MGALIDQILLWNTAADATVTLSPTPRAFRRKVTATHLLGGHLVVRPAELFEGPRWLFESAVEEHGYLYHLQRAGLATLVLADGTTLFDRAEWRFRTGGVFDRGEPVTGRRRVEKVRKRTMERAERLERAGWRAAAPRYTLAPAQAARELNVRFREWLAPVATRAFGTRLARTPVHDYLSGAFAVESRADLYPRIEREWSRPLGKGRKAFVRACKDALTLAALERTAVRYGGRVSEFRPTSALPFTMGSVRSHGRVLDAEVRVIRALAQVLPEMLTEAERRLGAPMVEVLRHDDPAEFVESAALVTAEDRQQLCDLLYLPTPRLEGECLACHVADADPPLRGKELRALVRECVEEMERDTRVKRQRLGLILRALLTVGAEVLLALLGVGLHPGIPASVEVAYELARPPESGPPLLMGLRTPLRAPPPPG